MMTAIIPARGTPDQVADGRGSDGPGERQPLPLLRQPCAPSPGDANPLRVHARKISTLCASKSACGADA